MSASGKLWWWFRLVNQLSANRCLGRLMPLHPCLIAPRTAKAAKIAPGGCLPAMLLCGFVDARLVALAPGAGGLDTGFLGQGADEAPDGVLLPARGIDDLLQCGPAGAEQQVAHDRLLAELAGHPRRDGVRGGRGRVGSGLGSLGALGLLRSLGGRPRS